MRLSEASVVRSFPDSPEGGDVRPAKEFVCYSLVMQLFFNSSGSRVSHAAPERR